MRARYIFTKLSPLARALFPVEDDAVLDWLNDDGHPVEPRFYVPLIPLILVRAFVYESLSANKRTFQPLTAFSILPGERYQGNRNWVVHGCAVPQT